MFTEDQKKFIVKAFGRNPCPPRWSKNSSANTKRVEKGEKGYLTVKYSLYQFYRVNKEFEKRGSVVRKQMVAKKRKKTEAKKEEVERLFAEHPSLSLRQAAPNVSVSMSTLHKLLKYVMEHKFYRITSVKRLQ